MKDVYGLSQLGVLLEDSCYMLHHKSESSLVVELKSKQHLDPLIYEVERIGTWLVQ